MVVCTSLVETIAYLESLLTHLTSAVLQIPSHLTSAHSHNPLSFSGEWVTSVLKLLIAYLDLSLTGLANLGAILSIFGIARLSPSRILDVWST